MYGHLLRRFRSEVERKVMEIAAEDDEDGRARRKALVVDELRDEREELEAKIRERRWTADPLASLISVGRNYILDKPR